MSFRDDFFAASPATPAREQVATAAGAVFVHQMSAGEKDRFERSYRKARGTNFRARLVIATARDAQGGPIFLAEDLDRLSELPLAVLEPIVEAAVRVNRLSDEEQEDVEKN